MSYSEESLKPACNTDVIIIGGGPSGLSCALLLGRCRRSVVVFDEGHPRNRRSKFMNGFISRDGYSPQHFLEDARNELAKYNVQVYRKKIVRAEKIKEDFHVYSEEGTEYICRKLVLATGIVDNLPDIPGIESFYGTSAFHCPYCDGWENSDKHIGVIGNVKGGAMLALNLYNWSSAVCIFLHGKQTIPEKERKKLAERNIEIYPQKITELHGADGILSRVEFEDGSSVPCDSIFFSMGFRQHCEIARQLNCEFSPKGLVKTNHLQQTKVEGFYVVGDASRDMQLVIVAASEGTKAGVAIHTALMTGK